MSVFLLIPTSYFILPQSPISPYGNSSLLFSVCESVSLVHHFLCIHFSTAYVSDILDYMSFCLLFTGISEIIYCSVPVATNSMSTIYCLNE